MINITIKLKIVLYVMLSMIIQYYYGKVLGVSGGGIGILVFALCDKLDDSFTILEINDKKLK